MIRIYKGELVCDCDECGAKEFGGTKEFADFIQEIKDAGWRIRKDGDEWQHYCPDCEAG